MVSTGITSATPVAAGLHCRAATSLSSDCCNLDDRGLIAEAISPDLIPFTAILRRQSNSGQVDFFIERRCFATVRPYLLGPRTRLPLSETERHGQAGCAPLHPPVLVYQSRVGRPLFDRCRRGLFARPVAREFRVEPLASC